MEVVITRVSHVCPDRSTGRCYADIKSGEVEWVWDEGVGTPLHCPHCGEKLPATLADIWATLIAQLPGKEPTNA